MINQNIQTKILKKKKYLKFLNINRYGKIKLILKVYLKIPPLNSEMELIKKNNNCTMK
jgi:hypothetical protein